MSGKKEPSWFEIKELVKKQILRKDFGLLQKEKVKKLK